MWGRWSNGGSIELGSGIAVRWYMNVRVWPHFFGFQGFLEGLGLLEVLFILPLGGVGGFVSWGRGRKFVLLVACLAFDCLGMGVCYMVFVDFILLYLHLVMFVGGL